MFFLGRPIEAEEERQLLSAAALGLFSLMILVVRRSTEKKPRPSNMPLPPLSAPLPDELLPRFDSTHIVFREATAAEKYEIWLLGFADPDDNVRLSTTEDRSLAFCVAKAVHLASQPLTKDGGLTQWVLVYEPPSSSPGNNELNHGLILASCELLRRRAVVASQSESDEPTVRESVAYEALGVFCRPEYRRRGYASRMMQELRKKLEIWNRTSNQPVLSVLHSAVGEVSNVQIVAAYLVILSDKS